MKDILKLGGILLLVTAIAGAALSMVNAITKPRIEEQKRLVTQRALTTALPKANPEAIVPVTENESVSHYIGYQTTEKQNIAGYAFVAKGAGYSSIIETMVGVDTTGTVMGIKIMQQVETPGLGTKIEEVRYGESSSWFQDQFLNRIADGLIVDKDGGDIISVTGATISCRAVANSIKKGMGELEERLGGFKVN
ncbi:RnfABCDGE type electron transport complex subunit G [candidate division KSB1 bacterium]|nr:RnfABCDGE type electron transport complex subunit G [candidate division KSB1 bacterium]MBL7092884.1 RnfABCDGE type electron transport complex subunit G [candidate division KSB1 bacterium]